MKKLIAMVLTACMALLTVSCAQSAPPTSSADSAPAAGPQSQAAQPAAPTVAPLEIKYATIFSPGDPMVDAMEKFKEVVEEKSGGAITVNLFFSGVLGDERELMEAIRVNSVQIISESSLADCIFYAPEYALFSTPYLIKDDAHSYRVWESEVGKEINDYIEENFGIYTMGLMDHGPRHVTSNKELRTPADLEGLKLRLPQNEVYIKVWTELGAIPVPIALSEVYGALQTGVVIAQENALATITANKFDEVQKYLIKTSHVVEGYKIQCNRDWWYGLSDEQRRILEESLAEATAYGNEVVAKSEQELEKVLADSGMTVIEPDVGAFKEKAMPMIEELGRSYFKPGLMDKILEMS